MWLRFNTQSAWNAINYLFFAMPLKGKNKTLRLSTNQEVSTKTGEFQVNKLSSLQTKWAMLFACFVCPSKCYYTTRKPI